jgi:hypothetical protein
MLRNTLCIPILDGDKPTNAVGVIELTNMDNECVSDGEIKLLTLIAQLTQIGLSLSQNQYHYPVQFKNQTQVLFEKGEACIQNLVNHLNQASEADK